jgi:hypothetical protein
VRSISNAESRSRYGIQQFIRTHYLDWFNPKTTDKPLLSPTILRSAVFPELKENRKTVFILIDNMRFDQWRVIQPLVNQYFHTVDEVIYSSILPTSTQYARNAIFAGLMPAAIQELYPSLWLSDDEEGNKNEHEELLLRNQMQRLGIKSRIYYEKIFNNRMGEKLLENLSNIMQNDLIVLVYNFVDMLSHANTDMEMIRELASSDAAYRSLTLSWFQHSNLIELLRELALKKVTLFITTDHGTIRVNSPIKVIGDKTTSKNLRYKLGKNLSYNAKRYLK